MSNLIIDLDTKEFDRRIRQVEGKAKENLKEAVHKIGDELLRISTKEVPHDEGILQASGRVDKEPEQAIVSYNTKYAARLHEHPEYKFKKGRKGKYLQDPLLQNFDLWRSIIRGLVSEALK